jgi:hypothetical protein
MIWATAKPVAQVPVAQEDVHRLSGTTPDTASEHML